MLDGRGQLQHAALFRVLGEFQVGDVEVDRHDPVAVAFLVLGHIAHPAEAAVGQEETEFDCARQFTGRVAAVENGVDPRMVEGMNPAEHELERRGMRSGRKGEEGEHFRRPDPGAETAVDVDKPHAPDGERPGQPPGRAAEGGGDFVLRGDVLQGGGEPAPAGGRIVKHLGDIADPAEVARGQHGAVVKRFARPPGIAVAHHLGEAFTVLRVGPFENGLKRGHAARRIESEQAIHLGRPGTGAVVEIDLDIADVGDGLGAFQGGDGLFEGPDAGRKGIHRRRGGRRGGAGGGGREIHGGKRRRNEEDDQAGQRATRAGARAEAADDGEPDRGAEGEK